MNAATDELTKQVRKLAGQFPDSRSATIPALQLAQEHNDGWLDSESFEWVGDALGLTPAYCQAVASFYDMFHLAPVGRHSIEVCTNLSCALSESAGYLARSAWIASYSSPEPTLRVIGRPRP